MPRSRLFNTIRGLDTTPRGWHLFDATGLSPGRLANHVTRLLMGKLKPDYDPRGDNGDNVVVLNVEKMDLATSRWRRKVYRSHSGYPGSLKEIRSGSMFERFPQRVLAFAVSGMLPKNAHRKVRLERLKIVVGSENPYADKFKNAPRYSQQLSREDQLLLGLNLKVQKE
eukprot:TRINITY_DN2389_c0_g1_i1.p1 TRINITY_DN2389_c0_g1~~TRINITY_DN2389_c0_g1_i1.p1  ORF type:complete len:169 (+),score=29.25 TRINITY_DN2389_c0_g1_i1:34-540(+)